MVAVMSVSDEPQSMPETLLVSIEKQEMLWRVVKQGAEKLTEFKRNQLYVSSQLLMLMSFLVVTTNCMGHTGKLKHSIDTPYWDLH